MADCINRQELLDDISDTVEFTDSAEARGANKVIERIKWMPAADVVEVVRCGECKHWKTEDDHCTHPAGLCATGVKARNNHCSFGKPKDGE